MTASISEEVTPACSIALFAAIIPASAWTDNLFLSSFDTLGIILEVSRMPSLSITYLVSIPDAFSINSEDECIIASILPLSISRLFFSLKRST